MSGAIQMFLKKLFKIEKKEKKEKEIDPDIAELRRQEAIWKKQAGGRTALNFQLFAEHWLRKEKKRKYKKAIKEDLNVIRKYEGKIPK